MECVGLGAGRERATYAEMAMHMAHMAHMAHVSKDARHIGGLDMQNTIGMLLEPHSDSRRSRQLREDDKERAAAPKPETSIVRGYAKMIAWHTPPGGSVGEHSSPADAPARLGLGRKLLQRTLAFVGGTRQTTVGTIGTAGMAGSRVTVAAQSLARQHVIRRDAFRKRRWPRRCHIATLGADIVEYTDSATARGDARTTVAMRGRKLQEGLEERGMVSSEAVAKALINLSPGLLKQLACSVSAERESVGARRGEARRGGAAAGGALGGAGEAAGAVVLAI